PQPPTWRRIDVLRARRRRTASSNSTSLETTRIWLGFRERFPSVAMSPTIQARSDRHGIGTRVATCRLRPGSGPRRRTEIPNRRSRRETVLAPQPNSLPISIDGEPLIDVERPEYRHVDRQERWVHSPPLAKRRCPSMSTIPDAE